MALVHSNLARVCLYAFHHLGLAVNLEQLTVICQNQHRVVAELRDIADALLKSSDNSQLILALQLVYVSARNAKKLVRR